MALNDTHIHTPEHTHTRLDPLDEGSARRKGPYVHNTQHLKYKKKIIPSMGFEPVIPASERPQTYSLYRDAVKHIYIFPNGRYIDCSSLTYPTNKSKTLKLQYRY